MLDRLDEMREDLNHNDFADDVNGARKATDLHNEVKRKILKLPVENIDNVGQQLLQRYVNCVQVCLREEQDITSLAWAISEGILRLIAFFHVSTIVVRLLSY